MDQYLTFALGGEPYGVDVLKVQEIRGYAPTTPVPNAPPYVKGVMNLRGAIIPVLDLRAKLGMAVGEITPVTAVVVVTTEAQKTVGLVVDAVTDVLDLDRGGIQPPPDFGSHVDTRLVAGLAQAGDRLVVLLDLERVVRAEDAAAAAA